MRETLRDLGPDPKREAATSREAVDKLEGDLADVRARLAALEARVTGKARGSASKPLNAAGELVQRTPPTRPSGSRPGRRKPKPRRA